MNIETPEGWVSCEIGEVTRIVSGNTPPSKDPTNFTTEGGIPWITPADLSGYEDMYISHGRRNLSKKGFAACSAAKFHQEVYYSPVALQLDMSPLLQTKSQLIRFRRKNRN